MLGKINTIFNEDLQSYIPENLSSNYDQGFKFTTTFSSTTNGTVSPKTKVYQLFTKYGGDVWCYINEHVIIELPSPKCFKYFTIQAWYKCKFSLHASNDGVNYQKLKEFQLENNGTYRPMKINNKKAYKFYKVVCDDISEYNGSYGRTTGIHFIHLT